MQRSSPGHMLPSPMRRAATDLRSIFVGNLPHSALEAELWDLFHVYGHILHIEIIRKPSVNCWSSKMLDVLTGYYKDFG